MRALQLSVGTGFLLLGIYVAASGISMKYYTTFGPGPGFFPLWLGAVLMVLSLAHLLTTLRTPNQTPFLQLLPTSHGMIKIAQTIFILVVFMALVDIVGFRISMLGLLFFVLFAIGQQSVIISSAVAVGGSLAIYYIFRDLLGVYLPSASVNLLQQIGL